MLGTTNRVTASKNKVSAHKKAPIYSMSKLTYPGCSENRSTRLYVLDLQYGTALKILYKNRPRKHAGARVVGGGVSIVYNKSRCSLRERKIVGNNFELVAAVGRVGKVPSHLLPLPRAEDEKKLSWKGSLKSYAGRYSF